jgi:ParB-like chromosome segregation protein Spo0J
MKPAPKTKSQRLVDDKRLDITRWKEYTPHPAMNLIPHMREDEFEDLKADIDKNGMKEPILFTGGLLLDGLHRYVAWKELKRKERVPRVRYHGTDPVGEVLSRNIFRRHIDPDQRIFIIAEARREELEAKAKERQLSGLRKGDKGPVPSKSTARGETPDQLAQVADVSPYKARQAADVSKYGTPPEKAAVSAGTARLKDMAVKARIRAAKTGKRKTRPKKEVDKTSKEYVKKKWEQFLDKNWPVTQHRAVKAIVHPLTEN